jgi:hypothetical protein
MATNDPGHMTTTANEDDLLQWDDEFVDRAVGQGVYDALASTEKSLHANACGHTAVPRFEVDAEARFFTRHLAVRPSGWGVGVTVDRPGGVLARHPRERFDGESREAGGPFGRCCGAAAHLRWAER